jgi:hypothetical protein
MINTEIEKKEGKGTTIDTMKQEEERTSTIPLIVIKKIGIGTILGTKEMIINVRENTFQMTEVTVCQHPKKTTMIKGLHFQETNPLNIKKEKLTRL